MSANLPDDDPEMDDPVEPDHSAKQENDFLRLHSFRRQIEMMQWRIARFRPSSHGAESSPLLEALEATVEELKVAVEELRQTNESLRESRADVEAERRRYRDLFDLAPDAYLVTDLYGVIRETNHVALALLNIESRFLVGKPLVLFLPEESRVAFRSEIGRIRGCVAGSSPAEYDLRLRPRKQPSFEASIRVSVERDPWGEPVALRWIIRDISSLKRTEETIRGLNAALERRVLEGSEQLESVLQTNERWLIKAHAADASTVDGQKLFRELVEEVDAILWRGDATTGRYTFVSKRAEELLGYPASRWIDEPDFWLERIHPDDREWAASYRRKQLRERLDHEAEYRLVAADGRTLWFRESVRTIQPGPDMPAVLYGLMVNITRRKKVERQLFTAKGELASQLRDMTYLHELAGRLTNARGLAATLEEILSAAVSLQGAERALLWLVEPGRDRPTIAAEFGSSAPFRRAVEAIPATLQPWSLEDVESEPEGSPWLEAGRLAGFRAVAVVPLFDREGSVLGAIATFFDQPYRMAARQLRLVEVYAEQAAEAIEAARLLGRIEEADRRKTHLLEAKSREMRAPLEAILEAARVSGATSIEEHVNHLIAMAEELAEESERIDRQG